MQKVIAETSIDTLVYLYDYHTKLYPNVIEGISFEDAHNRLNTKANHIAWIAGSLVHQRYELANALHIKARQASYDLFKDNKGIQDDVTYPTLEQFEKEWEEISDMLRNSMVKLTSEDLEGPEPFGMGEGLRLFDALAFIIDREAYYIGQVGLYRRLMGYDAMKYPD